MFEQNNVLWLSHIFRSSNHETENGFDDRESSMNTPSHHTNNLNTNNVSWVTDSEVYLIPSPSVKIQIMGGKGLLTMPSNVLSLCLKPIIWIFTKGEGEGINSRLPFKIFSNFNDDLEVVYFIVLVISFYVQKNEYFFFCSNHSL